MARRADSANAWAVVAGVLCLSLWTASATRQALRRTSNGPDIGDVFDRVRTAAVRIEAIASDTDFFRPYRPGEDWRSTGSGFAVSLAGLKEAGNVEPGSDADMRLMVAESLSEESPTFITNAHVVRNAHHVTVQMPAFSQEKFEAYVPVICEDFDIAIVMLKEPKQFKESLAHTNVSIRPFDIHVNNSNLVHMGLGVISIGFPLGSSTLKVGTGIISGTEQTGTRTRSIICYQSSAPISPGSSGGPLLARDSAGDFQVIGVNYASAASQQAQNTNYVLPSVHILPVLRDFVMREGFQAGLGMHVQLMFAPVAATLTESNDAIYNASGGCKTGAYLSKIEPDSMLMFADPPIQEQVQLVAVDGVALDKFGMGRPAGFDNPVPFGSILTAWADLDSKQTLSVCKNGNVSTHAVSLRWRPEYNLGIRRILEPHFEIDLLDYEVFAGVTLMRLTLNHMDHLLQDCNKWGTCTIGRWLLKRNQFHPRIIVTHVDQSSYAYNVVAEGMTVNSINGNFVSTIDDVRKYFQPTGSIWSLVTDRGIHLKLKFEENMAKQLMEAWETPSDRYLLTPAVKKVVADSPTLSQAVNTAFSLNGTRPVHLATWREADAELARAANKRLRSASKH